MIRHAALDANETNKFQHERKEQHHANEPVPCLRHMTLLVHTCCACQRTTEDKNMCACGASAHLRLL